MHCTFFIALITSPSVHTVLTQHFIHVLTWIWLAKKIREFSAAFEKSVIYQLTYNSRMFHSFEIFFCLLHEQCLNIRFEFCFVWSKKCQLKCHTDFCLTGFCWYFFNFQVLLTVMHHRFEVCTYSYQPAFIVYLRTKT